MITIRFGKVLGNFGLETELLDKLDVHGLGPGVSSDQLDVVGLGWTVGFEVEFVNGAVDRLLCHGSVSRPLSTGDGEQTALGHVDHVVSDQTLGVFRVGVLDQRSQTTPGGQDISTTNLDVGGEVVSDLVENPLDLLLGRNGVLLDRGGRIGCSGNNVSLPWQEEDDTSVRRGRVEKTKTLRAVVVGQGDVNSGRRGNNLLSGRLVELSDTITERSSSVDDTLDVSTAILLSGA